MSKNDTAVIRARNKADAPENWTYKASTVHSAYRFTIWNGAERIGEVDTLENAELIVKTNIALDMFGSVEGIMKTFALAEALENAARLTGGCLTCKHCPSPRVCTLGGCNTNDKWQFDHARFAGGAE